LPGQDINRAGGSPPLNHQVEVGIAAKALFARATHTLFAEENRGLLLDISIFVANLFLMRLLTELLIDLFSQVSAENPTAKLALGLLCVCMWFLPVAGAVLKRWHFHQRVRGQVSIDKPAEVTATPWSTRKAKRSGGITGGLTGEPSGVLAGCLFNPIFYFCLNLVIMAAILTGLGDVFFGKRLLNNGGLFTSLVLVGFVLTIIQTFLIYRYFSPPKHPPKSKFLISPQSEALGDICIFLNMILFQVAWNLLTFAPLGPPGSLLEFAGRLFFLCFIALLIYFPPRMFYLAEDINRKRTWLTMLLANSPVILRVLFGTSSASSGMMSGW
jgi:hypothetical protein